MLFFRHTFEDTMPFLKATPDNIKKASKIVGKEGLVIFPTDTVYGLGCNPFNIEAVEKVFKVKGERKNKPLPILASSLRAVERIAHMNKNARKIAKQYWPGPLTLVVPKKPTLPNMVTCSLESVGVRIPNHKVALQLITLCGGLLVGTSANKTGEKPPKTAQEAARQLGEEVDIVLDDGPTPLGQESSVIDLTQKEPKILREGTIKLKHITDTINDVQPFK
jgi:L-threonylcarbamoyladenylate synthase